MNELVKISNGVPVVSSRDVSERFGKRHTEVLRAIDNQIEVNAILRSPNYFTENLYLDKSNRQSKEYLMTRDGFSFIVMSFTGKEADTWKIKYIDAFNKMEIQLRTQYQDSYMIEDPVKRAERWIEEAQERKMLSFKVDNLDKENDLLSSKNLKWAGRKFINATVRQYAGHACDGSFGAAWTDFKKELLYKHGINLNSRITKYLNETGKKTKPQTLEMLDNSEVPNAVSTIVSMCRDKSVDIGELINKVSQDSDSNE